MLGSARDSATSIVEMVKDLPRLIVNVAKAEVSQLKAEYTAKAKYAGVGIGLFVGAAVFLYFMLCVLVAAAILGIATALPAWLAALIVAAALLVIAIVLALVGVAFFKRINGVKPSVTVESVKEDAEAMKGMGPYGR